MNNHENPESTRKPQTTAKPRINLETTIHMETTNRRENRAMPDSKICKPVGLFPWETIRYFKF